MSFLNIFYEKIFLKWENWKRRMLVWVGTYEQQQLKISLFSVAFILAPHFNSGKRWTDFQAVNLSSSSYFLSSKEWTEAHVLRYLSLDSDISAFIW